MSECNKTKELILDRLHKSSSFMGIGGNTTLSDMIPVNEILEAINLDNYFSTSKGRDNE